MCLLGVNYPFEFAVFTQTTPRRFPGARVVEILTAPGGGSSTGSSLVAVIFSTATTENLGVSMVFRYLVAVVAVEHNSVYGFLYFILLHAFTMFFSLFIFFR